MEEKTKPNWSTPISIVIAGLLIASAIFYGDTRPEATKKIEKPTDHLPEIVKDLKLDEEKFNLCMKDKTFAERVNADLDNGVESGGRGTPFVIILGPNGEAIDMGGAAPLDKFEATIESIKSGKTAELAQSQDEQLSEQLKNIRPIDPAKDHILGNQNASIKIVEYSDIQCPYCAKVHPTIKEVVEKYDGEVMWVYRHFPLNIHQYAEELALATECAASLGGNDAFWQTLDGLFERIFSN